MARKKRTLSPTGIYHWIVRGIHKKFIFHSDEDFRTFKEFLYQHKNEFDLSIYHYCLMGNHVHLLIRSEEGLGPLISFSHVTLRKYAYYYEKKHRWIGSVFQRGYKSIPVDREVYLLECGRYIERNPVKAGMVDSPGQYPHSSHLFYRDGRPDRLITPSPAYLALDNLEVVRRKVYAQYVEATRVQEQELLRSSCRP